jgi:hypothetical protein
MAMGLTNHNVSFRGFNQSISNKVLVLIDGRPEYQDFLGQTLWPSIPIALEEIERIEVIRGPGSAMCGSNAMLGVVNIITRAPGAGPAAAFSGLAGNGNLAAGHFVASGGQRLKYRVSAGDAQGDKYSRDFSSNRPDQRSTLNDENLGVRSVRASASVFYAFNEDFRVAASGSVNRLFTELYAIGLLRNFWLDGVTGFAKADLTAGPVKLDLSTDVSFVTGTAWVEREPSPGDPTQIANLQNPLAAYAVINARVGYRFPDERVSAALIGSQLGPGHREHPSGNLVSRRIFAPLTVTLDAAPIDEKGVHQPLPVFLARLVDANGDGVPDDSNGDGVPDFWPRVVVRKLADGAASPLIDENDLDRNGVLDATGATIPRGGEPDLVVLAAGFDFTALVPQLVDGLGRPNPNPLPVTRLQLVIQPRALDVSDPARPAVLKTVPGGRYAITVIQQTGQTRRVPNELTPGLGDQVGLPSLAPQSFVIEVP